MKPVWMVRSRQIAQRLSFWLTLIGYDPHDHSLSHRIYLIYASVFMSLWAFAVLSLAAGGAATMLSAIGTGSINQTAAQMSLFIFVIWFMYQLWQVSRRSPFLFSEEDAFLICQTPVKRNIVAVSRFMDDWFEQALPFWAIGVILGFALVESQLGGKVGSSALLRYAVSGFRAFSVFFPLQLGLLAFVWAVGSLRLQGNREWRSFPHLVLIMIVLTAGCLIWSVKVPEWDKPSVPIWQVVSWVLSYPLEAAFSIHPWMNGMLVALGIAIVGLVALTRISADLNLSRAAQESAQREKIQDAQRYGMIDLVREMRQRDRLGIGREPARLRAQPGLWVLPWKDILQSMHQIGLSEIWNWLILLGTSLGIFLAPDLSSRILIFFFWLIAVCQRMTSRLRSDLANWWLFRSLPFHAEKLLLMELVTPLSLTVAIGWLALIFVDAGLGAFRTALVLFIPPACMILGLISTYDILRQSNAEMLSNGNVPVMSWLAVLGGMLCLAIPAGIALLLSQFMWIGVFLAFAVSLVLIYGVCRVAVTRYRSIS